MGFKEQKPLLDDLVAMIPAGVDILLASDRFYGHPKLVRYCLKKGLQNRVRLKQNLTLLHQGGKLSVGELLELLLQGIENANLCDSGDVTSIYVLHEEGHEEPWFIALNGKLTPGKVLDYGMRWGIEVMFSDWKTRGFLIFMTRLKSTDRFERLLMLISIACHYAVSTGMQPDRNKPKYSAKKSARCLLSLFQHGLRLIRVTFANCTEMSQLWKADNFHW